MKKFLSFILMLMFIGSIYAAKATSYTDVSDIILTLTFNEKIHDIATGTMKYYPISSHIKGEATTSDGGYKFVSESKDLGVLSETKYTKKQIYDLLPAPLQSLFKDLHANAISENVSQ